MISKFDYLFTGSPSQGGSYFPAPEVDLVFISPGLKLPGEDPVPRAARSAYRYLPELVKQRGRWNDLERPVFLWHEGLFTPPGGRRVRYQFFLITRDTDQYMRGEIHKEDGRSENYRFILRPFFARIIERARSLGRRTVFVLGAYTKITGAYGKHLVDDFGLKGDPLIQVLTGDPGTEALMESAIESYGISPDDSVVVWGASGTLGSAVARWLAATLRPPSS